MRSIAWTIAGSDPSGGAGIQADIKTMNALGVHACSVITALTVQNTQGVFQTEVVSSSLLKAQLDALANDLPPIALKTGMLGNSESVEVIAEILERLTTTFVVCDPVMISTSGRTLLETSALEIFKANLLPQVDLLTPNVPEVETLTGLRIQTLNDMEKAAESLLGMGVQSVLIKGGHPLAEKSTLSQDYWSNGKDSFWLTSPRKNGIYHGTGCTLSAAITACMAMGMEERDAVVVAKAYINQAMRCSPGKKLLAHSGWPETYEDLPWLTQSAEAGQERPHFPECGEMPLGVYPIVDRADWLETLLPLGVTTIQLRVKDLEGDALEAEIARAVAIAKTWKARLFINDYWQMALKHQAYGVHLGQEDLNSADLQVLNQAGLRLGLSTHCYHEVARALALRPSYIAIGPVFATTTKAMRFAPQGLEALRRWRKSLPYPLVAIAGIFLENAPAVLETGVDGIAVVRDIVNAPDPAVQVARWLNLFKDGPCSNYPNNPAK